MVIDARQGWSRVSVQTITTLSEQKSHMKWRAFLFTLILFVFLEVAVVMYVGLGSGTHLTSASARAANQRQDSVFDIRWHLGLDADLESNGSHEMAFLYGNTTLSFEIFAEHYTELCENYFIPRTINANERFFGLFDQISNHRLGDSVSEDDRGDKLMPAISDHHVSLKTGPHNTSRTSEATEKLCSCVPESLNGPTNVTMDVPYVGELELAYPDIKQGGHWKPSDCVPRHRTAIIIPFRDREEHLRILLSYLHPMLQRQMLYYTIFVVEQIYPAVFNKASIMNAGYREATLADSFDCFIFHDVDMIPENDYNFYTCTAQPRHVGSHCDKFNYKIKASGMRISRFPGSIARYTMIKHGSDAGNPYNSKSYVAWQSRPDHYRRNGINQLRYYRREMELRPLYTWFLIELPDPDVLPNPVTNRNKSASADLDVPSLVTLLTYLSLLYLTLVGFC
ncbi:hypothetical protein LSH36_371g02015 [Paralvinella palmiformis]|uniref:Beta-1,4-galactosyltransferase n=1 Tax=Paralvinella palmiformis TaxID=53620 RepID=A0AAD9N1Y0_9ANNE|nr:hypothetical protein LSH36_371g02015 [Paralvinella palmiformis]